MRKISVVAFIGVAILLGWIMLRRDDAPESRPKSSTKTSAAQEDPTESDTESTGKTVESVPFEESAVKPGKDTQAADTTSTVGVREIEIRVVVRDEQGQRHEAEDGVISFRADINDRSQAAGSLRITSGRARMRVSEPFRVWITKGELGGRKLKRSYEGYEAPKSGPWIIEVEWFNPFVLRVQDAETKIDLSGIEIRRITDFKLDVMQHPGAPMAGKVIVSNAASPVALVDGLSPDGRENSLWVGAPGYAWALTKTISTGADGLVRLERGGDLEIRVTGNKPPKGTVLRVRPKGKSPSLEAKLPKGESCDIRGLKPELYEVTAELGDWFSSPLVVARTDVRVVEGGSTTASLVINDAPKKPVPTQVRGILRVDPIWHEDLAISLKPIGKTRSWVRRNKFRNGTPLKRIPGTQGDFSFTLTDITSGAWQLVVQPMAYRKRLDIPRSGANNLLIELPAPAQVFVKLLDAKSGALFPSTPKVYWHSELIKGAGGFSPKSASYDAQQKAYTFTATAGKVYISTSPEGYQGMRRDLMLIPGDNRLEMSLNRNCGLLINARWQGKDIPINWDWEPKLAALSGSGKPMRRGPKDGKFFIAVSEPGKYRLTFTTPGAYEALAPIEVTIPQETILPLTIEVESKQ